MTERNEIEMPDWVISDTHFFHTNINKYSARCTPAYPTPEDVDQLMIYNWHNLVKPEHTVLHLGDLGFFKAHHDTKFLKDLPGTKLFVRGNHDKNSPEWFAEHGFIEIPAPSVWVGDTEVLFTHYPQKKLFPDQINVAGHVHNNPWSATPRHINVSVELWHYAPVDCQFIVDKLLWSSRTNADDSGPRTVKFRGKR